MSEKERASLGFGDELETFDPTAWPKAKAPPSIERHKPEIARQAAEATGFRSREAAAPTDAAPPPRQQRRRRTGRNVQLNIKTTQQTVDTFTTIADAQGWGFGETLERAIALLEGYTPPKAK